MQALAFAAGILPREFWQMTPREFANCLEGHRQREMSDMRKRAWEVMHVVSPWTKRRLSVAMLLGEDTDDGIQPESAEEFHALMRARLEMAEQRRSVAEATHGHS
jgi:hypothetical protein